MNPRIALGRGRLVCASLVLLVAQAQGALPGLTAIDDDSLAEVTGAGVAILPENLKIVFDDIAYVQGIPTGAPAFGQVADMYWYGLALTGADGNVTSRVGSTIASWGTAANPWLLKVESPVEYKYSTSTSATNKEAYPVLNYYAPSYTPGEGGLKYAFWGDVVVRNPSNPSGCAASATGPTCCAVAAKMRSQSIWNNFSLNGSRMSLFQNTVDQSFGLAWLNRINSAPTGQLRLSFNLSSADAASTSYAPVSAAPTFTNTEGLYFTDLDINVVAGTLHYQPVILDNAANADDARTPWNETKNFSVELARIPNSPSIYNHFYEDYSGIAMGAVGAKTCTNSTVDCAGATHGQVSIGKVEFKDPSGTAVDLGGVNINGLMLQHMKITTTGL